MNDLNDALKDLKQKIVDDGYHVGMVEFVAREWQINPELLHRKFVEAEKVEPEAWDPTSIIVAQLQRGRAEAKAMSRNFAQHTKFVEIEGAEVEVTGILVKTLDRRQIVVVAMHPDRLIGVDIRQTTRGNPLEVFPYRTSFGSREKFIEQVVAELQEKNQGG